MKNSIKVCIIGGGNISNTRHIPALKKIKEVEKFETPSKKYEFTPNNIYSNTESLYPLLFT